MSTAPQTQPMPAAPPPVTMPLRRPGARRLRLGWVVLSALLAGAGWGAWRLYERLSAPSAAAVPTALVQRGDVRLDVYAQGTLKGGHSQMLVAPPVAGGTLSIKTLLPSGTEVHAGEVVVAFDTAAQEYNLTQANEALEQAQQQVIQAQATAAAQTEDNAYQMAKANFDVQRAELKVKHNPVIDAVDAKKNDLALAGAQDHLAQLQKDVASQQANNVATIAVQQAAERKAQADAATAKHNIASMTLRATHDGYVSVRQNTSSGIIYAGMALPAYQVGDTARPGQAVVEIPDTSSWEVDLTVSELDAGHLAPGEPAAVRFVALPGQDFDGKVQSVGAAGGPPWARTVSCVVQLLHPTPALRPGLSVNAVITTGVLPHVLWAPSEAVFGTGGATYVYQRVNGQFQRQSVTVAQRSESQAVLQGVRAGEVIALADPEQAAATAAGRGRGAAAPTAVLGGRGR